VRDEIFADREDVRAAETLRRQIEQCGTAQAAPACQVEVRYIYQVCAALRPSSLCANAAGI